MKRIIFILMGLFISILSTSVLAFPPEPGNDPDVLPVPINDYLWMLIAVGLVYVYFKFKTFILQGNNNYQINPNIIFPIKNPCTSRVTNS